MLCDFELRVSIHAPRMGRDGDVKPARHNRIVSIHAPRMGRDNHDEIRAGHPPVSIHAPRMGRDPEVHKLAAAV